jgi:AcrR family transcriptional regulator
MERSRIESRRAKSMDAEAGGKRRPGRPRSEEAHGAILDAAISLIREVGYDALAMEAIAARAGAGKATLYRRWATKETLVAEALERIVRSIPTPDTGTTEGDLRVMMRDSVAMYRDPATQGLLSGLVAAMARSERIAQAVRSGFIATRRDALRQVLERGMARGDLRKDLDFELALDLLSGPLLFRMLITGGRIDERLTRGVVEAVLRGLAPKS